MTDYSGTRVYTQHKREIIIGDLFAEGGQGKVYLVGNSSNEVVKILRAEVSVAWMLRCEPLILPPQLWQSDESLRSLPRDTFNIDGSIGYISKRAPGKTFSDLLTDRDYPRSLSLRSKLQICLSLARGVRIIHSQKIILADLCEENLIISLKRTLLRIIDIDGLGVTGKYRPIVEKPRSATPIELSYGHIEYPDQVSDLWSLAIILHRLLVGGHPFPFPLTVPQIWDISNPVKYPTKKSHEETLEFVGNGLANLFERVFGNQRFGFLGGTRTNRPKAQEWETAIERSLKSLKLCTCGKPFVPAAVDVQLCPACFRTRRRR